MDASMTVKKGPSGSKNLRPGMNGGKGADPERRARFVAEYLICFNATKAAKLAGYSERSAHTTGHSLLKVPEIQAQLAAAKAKFSERYEITAERIAHEMACIGYANPLDYLCVTGQSAGEVDLSLLTRDQAAAISEISFGKKGKGAGMKVAKIKLANKQAALQDLGRYVGMFKDEGPQNLKVTFILEGLTATPEAAE